MTRLVSLDTGRQPLSRRETVRDSGRMSPWLFRVDITQPAEGSESHARVPLACKERSGAILLAPAIALAAAIFVDRGPAGEPRLSTHLFPVALWIFDDFSWTCVRNSVIFAALVSVASLVGGVFLGWFIARRLFWGRWILRPLIVALVTVAPAFLALGLLGVFGDPRPWPWPFAVVSEGIAGVSLESWNGLPLWIMWIWTTLPWGVAVVTLATVPAVEQLQPSWEDSARLVGVASLRVWKIWNWPFVRPSSARAAAFVFVMALVEPGALDSGVAAHTCISSDANCPTSRSVSCRGSLGDHGRSSRTCRLGRLAVVGGQPDQDSRRFDEGSAATVPIGACRCAGQGCSSCGLGARRLAAACRPGAACPDLASSRFSVGVRISSGCAGPGGTCQRSHYGAPPRQFFGSRARRSERDRIGRMACRAGRSRSDFIVARTAREADDCCAPVGTGRGRARHPVARGIGVEVLD